VMPGIDGFEVARRLQAEPATAGIPIIFMTGLTETEHVVAAFAAGGTDYVTKPIRPREVLARIGAHLNTARAQRQARNALDAFGHATLVVRERDGRRVWQTALARRLLAELEEARETVALRNAKLEELEGLKETLTQTLVHDLKNPLTAIIGTNELIQLRSARPPSPEIAQSAGIAELAQLNVATAAKMNSIIEALLLLASIRRHAEVSLGPVSLDDLMRVLAGRIAHQQEQLRGAVEWPDRELPWVWGHTAWIEEALVNYLTNALKFGGKPPRVCVSCEERPGGRVRIRVSDNGPGVPQSLRGSLFLPFTRLQKGVEGHGLGLSIVQRIAERLDGAVGYEEQEGPGGCFWLELRAAPPG